MPATLAGFRNLSRAECRHMGTGRVLQQHSSAVYVEREHWVGGLGVMSCNLRGFSTFLNLTGWFWGRAWAGLTCWCQSSDSAD